jgi:anti-sigma regulatory factor (Ser/Thr protein kinase)
MSDEAATLSLGGPHGTIERHAVELIAGSTHTAFTVPSQGRSVAAHDHALACARALSFDEDAAQRLERVVTELESNLARHAREGRLLIALRTQQADVEVIAIDEGPGLGDRGAAFHQACTGGLGAVREAAQTFDLYSSSRGTVVLARVQRQGTVSQPSGEFSVGAVCVPVRGEVVCGDAWMVAFEGHQARLMLADGLGHGPGAAQAANEALLAFRSNPMASPRQHMHTAHRRLGSTRGAAVSVFALDAQQDTVRLSGAGNVLGRVLSGVTDKSLMPQSGTVGLHVRVPEEVTTPWPAHAVLIAFSDGLVSRWDAPPLHPLLALEPTLLAAVLLRDHCRGADDATVVVLRRTN